jgi:hypothetical protein
MSDPGSVVSDLKNEIRWITAKAHADNRWLRMANGVTDGFLRNSQEIFLDRGRHAFFRCTG